MRTNVSATLMLLTVTALGCGSHRPPVSEFERLAAELRPNERVRVTTDADVTDGKLVSIDANGLTLRGTGADQTLLCSQIQRVEKRGDSVWNGALIGAAIIALPAWNGCQNKGRDLKCVAIGLGVFAGLGAALDAAHVGSQTRYVARKDSCARAR